MLTHHFTKLGIVGYLTFGQGVSSNVIAMYVAWKVSCKTRMSADESLAGTLGLRSSSPSADSELSCSRRFLTPCKRILAVRAYIP